LEAEGSMSTSEDKAKVAELLKEKERKERASVLEAKGWKRPVEVG